MKQIHTKAEVREQLGPASPHKYDEEVSSEIVSKKLKKKVTLWSKMPTKGPNVPILGTIFMIVTMILLVVWVIFGLIWFFYTRSIDILMHSPGFVSLVGIAWTYRRYEMRKGRVRSRHPSRPLT